MSIQRYSFTAQRRLECHKEDDGDYVLYTDHLTDKQAALDAQQAAHAAGVERMKGDNKKYVEDLVDRGIMMINVLTVKRDAAVRERDAAVEALRFYAEEDRQSVELEILESVDLRPATAALAKIEDEYVMERAIAALADMEQKS